MFLSGNSSFQERLVVLILPGTEFHPACTCNVSMGFFFCIFPRRHGRKNIGRIWSDKRCSAQFSLFPELAIPYSSPWINGSTHPCFEHQAIIRYVQTWFLVRTGANSAIHILMLKSQSLMVKSHFWWLNHIFTYVQWISMVTSAFWDQVMTKHLFWESAFVNDLILATWLWMGTQQCFGVAFYFRKPPYSPYSDNSFICSIPVGGSCAIRFLVDELGGMSPQFMGIFSRDNADEA